MGKVIDITSRLKTVNNDKDKNNSNKKLGLIDEYHPNLSKMSMEELTDLLDRLFFNKK